MADTVAHAVDNAMLAGASVADVNNIITRQGHAPLQEIPQSEAPTDFVEAPVGGSLVADTATVWHEPDSQAEPSTGPFSWTEEVKKSPDTNRRIADAMDNAARASALGQSPTVAYQAVKEDSMYDPDARAEMYMSNTGKSLKEIESELALRAVGGESVPAILKEKGIHPITDSSSDAMAAARAYVASVPTSSVLTAKEKDDIAFLKYVDFMTAKVSDDIGLNWSTAKDFAGYLVPQENLRYNQIASAMGIDYQAMDFVDYTDFLKRSSAYIRSEAPDKRQQLVETIIDAWPEIKGNNRLALVDFLQNIQTGPDEMFRHGESAIERGDQVSLGYGLASGKLLTGFLRGLKVIKTASQLKNLEAVADSVTIGAKGGLKEAGVEPIDALSTLDPSDHVNTLNKGADNTHATEVGNIQRGVDVYLDAASRVNDYGLGLNEEEKLAAHDRAVKNITDRGGITNVEVSPIDEKNFQLSFLREDANGGPAVRVKVKANYTFDDADALVSAGGEGHTNALKVLTSPNFRYTEKADRQLLIQLPEQLQYQGDYIKGMYDGAIKEALKPLSRTEMKGVDYLLTKGDEAVDDLGQNIGKVYTRDEAVVDGVEGVKLTDKQYQSYVDVRKIVDHLHYAKNKEILDYYKANKVKLVDWQGQTAPIKAYETPQAALKGYRNASSTKSHWIGMEDGSIKPYKAAEELTADFAEEMYAKGYQLARAAEGRLVKAGETNVEWVFAPRQAIREPSGIVLNKRIGYMPKIKKNAFYFVKEENSIRIGGSSSKVEKTVRYFDNYTDAAQHTEELNKLNPGKYRVLADRELSHSQVDQEFIRISGGLFTGARSEGVPFGLAAKEGERADSLEGLQRYVRNIARNAPMNLYREAMQQRWVKHATDLKALPSDYVGSFAEAVHPQHLDLESTSSAFLRDSHAQISFFSGIRTEAERKMLSNQRAIARFLERIPGIGKPLSRRVLNSSLEGASGTVRGLSFNLMLGLYNPAQFIVQASGSLVALSINPIHGLKAISQLPMYSALDLLISNPAEKAKMISNLRKLGYDLDGYEIWNKAGIRESVTTSNLDYHSLWSDKPYDANLLQKVLSNSTVFYKNGELISARLAFSTAYNYWKTMNPAAKVDTLAVKAILARTEVYRLNMSKANSAGFQTGLLSIPTQYQQVNTKFFEKLLGKSELTDLEKTRLLVAQFTLFGAAGVPLANTVMPHFLDMINNFIPDENKKINALNSSPALLNTLYNGALGYIIQDWADVHSVITGRMALGGDFIEKLFAIPTGVVSISDVAMGPFGTVYDNSKHAIERTWTAFTTVMQGDEAQPEDFAAVAQILARSVLEIPASTRNLYKAYDMTNSEFFKNKAGRPVAEWGSLNTQTIIFQGLGFGSQEVADFYELNARPMSAAQPATSVQADRIVRMLADMHNSGDAQQERWNAMAINTIMTTYSRPEDRLKLINDVTAKLNEPTDAWGTLMQKVLVDWQSELNAGLGEFHKQIQEQTSPAVARQLASRGMNRSIPETPVQPIEKK